MNCLSNYHLYIYTCTHTYIYTYRYVYILMHSTSQNRQEYFFSINKMSANCSEKLLLQASKYTAECTLRGKNPSCDQLLHQALYKTAPRQS